MAEYGASPDPIEPKQPPKPPEAPTQQQLQALNQARGCIGFVVLVFVLTVAVNLLGRCSNEEKKSPANTPSEGYIQQLQTAPDAAVAAVVSAKERETPFTPGVAGRSANEVCSSTTPECQQWTALAVGCEENIKRRDAGYMGQFSRNYCDEMEVFRERITGVENSSSPGAYSF